VPIYCQSGWGSWGHGECEPITGIWGRVPSVEVRVHSQGAWSGGQANVHRKRQIYIICSQPLADLYPFFHMLKYPTFLWLYMMSEIAFLPYPSASYWWCVKSPLTHSLIKQGNFEKIVIFLTCEWFLTCVSHIAHVIYICWTSVCLSVTRWYCVETAQPIVKLSSLPGSSMILVFW